MEPHLPMMAGIYSTGMEDVPVTTAYDKAKVACDSIRKSETSTWRFYTRDMSDRDKRRHYIQTNLDRAISEKWIKVYCQAIVRALNEKVCDEEALARWLDPEIGFLAGTGAGKDQPAEAERHEHCAAFHQPVPVGFRSL